MSRHNIFLTLISVMLFIFTFFLYIADISDYGVTWDEFFHRPTGREYTNFLRTKNLQPIVTNEQASWFPPVAVSIGYMLIENKTLKQFLPTDMDRFHLAAILFASITSVAVFLVAWLLFHRLWMAIFSYLLLISHPQFIVQAHTNVRDMGLMMFYSLTILSLLKVVKSKYGLIWMSMAGVLAGIATDTKQNGAFLVIIGLLWFGINIKRLGIRWTLIGSLVFTTCFLLSFFIFWPYLWVDTVHHLQLVWHFLTTPSIIAGNTTFFDKIYESTRNIPIYYPWAMLFILTPPLFGILAAIGFFISLFHLIKNDKNIGILSLWIFIPLSRFFFPKSSIAYDQIRHFLEVIPTLPLFASLTIVAFLYQARKKVLIKRLVVLLSLFTVFYNAYVSLKYRPFGNAYFNLFAGPPEYVTHAFDVEYWGNVYRQAVLILNQKYGDSKVYYTSGLGSHLLLEDGLKGKLIEDFSKDFDFVIFMNKQNWIRDRQYIMWLLKNKKPSFTIEREGKVLFYQFLPYKEEYLPGR